MFPALAFWAEAAPAPSINNAVARAIVFMLGVPLYEPLFASSLSQSCFQLPVPAQQPRGRATLPQEERVMGSKNFLRVVPPAARCSGGPSSQIARGPGTR